MMAQIVLRHWDTTNKWERVVAGLVVWGILCGALFLIKLSYFAIGRMYCQWNEGRKLLNQRGE